jgi:predicted nucleotidyltransferase
VGLTAEQKEALRQLRRSWPQARIVIVGAAALGEQLDVPSRQTKDLDLVVAVELDEVPRTVGAMSGWTADPAREHRWLFGDTVVDLLPAGPKLLEAGRLEWPRSGQIMSLEGFDVALAQSVPLVLDDEATVDLAGVAAVVLLKMVAFLDRPAQRERDLEDIAHCLRWYLEPEDDRRYDDAVLDSGVSWADASAFVLGADLRGMTEPRHRDVVRRFLAAVSEDGVHFYRMARTGPVDFREDPEALASALRAFRQGFGEVGAEGQPLG